MKKGIDISEHNGTIDFTKLKNSGVEFVILRIGWIGNNHNHTLDKKFIEYYNECYKNNIKVGIYVYSYCKSISAIKDGVDWLLGRLLLHTPKPTFGIFLDLEDSSIINCGKEELTGQAVTFCNMIENAGYKAGVYANKDWFTNYLDISKLITYKIWLAEWNNKDFHTANFKVDMWQYTSNGHVDGILSPCDMNYCISCQNLPVSTETEDKGSDFQMKLYQNGTTKEVVYQDKNCTKKIGYLHPHEQAECYGIIDNKALIVYNVDRTNNKKTGFVKWLGGVK